MQNLSSKIPTSLSLSLPHSAGSRDEGKPTTTGTAVRTFGYRQRRIRNGAAVRSSRRSLEGVWGDVRGIRTSPDHKSWTKRERRAKR